MRNVPCSDTNGGTRGLPDTTPSVAGHDTTLCQAAEVLINAVRICTELSTTALASSRSSADYASYDAAGQMRDEAFRELTGIRAISAEGLAAKADALGALVEWMDYEDARLGQFAVELVREYRAFVALLESDVRPRRPSIRPPLRGISRILRQTLHL